MRCRFPLLRWGCPVADLKRYALGWPTRDIDQPVLVPDDTGYWTPWQEAEAEHQRLREDYTHAVAQAAVDLSAMRDTTRAVTLAQVEAAIRAKFTPALNTGAAMDALVCWWSEALKELGHD